LFGRIASDYRPSHCWCWVGFRCTIVCHGEELTIGMACSRAFRVMEATCKAPKSLRSLWYPISMTGTQIRFGISSSAQQTSVFHFREGSLMLLGTDICLPIRGDLQPSSNLHSLLLNTFSRTTQDFMLLSEKLSYSKKWLRKAYVDPLQEQQVSNTVEYKLRIEVCK
jgi:hypothetical protein